MPFPPRPMPEKFWPKVQVGQADECWPWMGGLASGYGAVRLSRPRRMMTSAHRVAYELLVGPIPEGLVIDHLCRNRRCCNPAHMEPVTHRVNLLRGESRSAENARKTHCKNGHPFDDLNTYLSDGARRCRTCWRERSRSRRAAA